MEPLPRARRLYLARFFVLGGCILGLVCASTLFRPAAVEPTLLLGEGGPQGLTHGVVRGSHGYEVVLLEDADDDALLASGGYSAGASHASGFGVLKVEAAARRRRRLLRGRVSRGRGAASRATRLRLAPWTERAALGRGSAGWWSRARARVSFPTSFVGYLTHREIVAHAINARCEIACEGRVPPRVAAFLREQEAWTAATVAERAASDPLWRHVRDVRDQFEGVVDGVDAAVRADASGAFGPGGELSWAPFAEMLHPEDLRAFGGAGDDAAKSALRMAVRLVNSIGELIDVVPAVLHPGEREDMFHYAMMNRIYKHYSLPGVPGASQSFSSYPGTLSSFDDFYLIKETSLVILQTTNGT
ncbi:hypothetical protein JL720_12368 [Aureococcus anophagefferens]|nr:hypothetical protein JL720_12368 [Aureococcus anophagefferens]